MARAAGHAEVREELERQSFRDAGHAASRPDAAPLDQGRDDADSFVPPAISCIVKPR